MNHDPALWSCKRQAAAIANGELGCRDLLEVYIDRIGNINPVIMAVISEDFETARARADLADAAVRRGDPLGPLHGLPITLKDALATRGLRSTGGATELSAHLPDTDAPVVGAVRAAGANIMAKTNLPRWSGDVQAYNELFGTTCNPWNTDRVPGGSSGGAAAAVACGLTAFEIGTDIGGSIRFPAAFCGVFGHKPSFGIVPSSGYLDHVQGGTTEADINVIGPIARAAEDLPLLLDVLLRRESPWRVELPPPPAALERLRIATWLDGDFCPVDQEVLAKLGEVVSAMEGAGYQVTRDRQPDFDAGQASDLARSLVVAAVSPAFPPGSFTHRDWLDAHRRRVDACQRWEAFFEDFDIVLMPVCFVPPFPHLQDGNFNSRTLLCNGETRPYSDLVRWTMIVGMAGLPSTVPPIGLGTGGLPIGIQVVGRYGADLTTIALASEVSNLMGGFVPPPIAATTS
ncbi:MAG: amidase family protein [Proteobacteria bacterium]|nr:amidase family protein [Pseudomonadota bacterium]